MAEDDAELYARELAEPSVTVLRPPPGGHQVLLPVGTVIDGAVVELAQHPDGLITADVRIPAHQP